MKDRLMSMRQTLAETVDNRVATSLERLESKIDYRPIKVASWGIAGASILGFVAAGFGAAAAAAGAYIAVRGAIRITREGRDRPNHEDVPVDLTGM
jgi:hypothetical protein